MLSGGEQVRQYRLERALGEGGAAAVWLAADTKLGRRVAIKLLAGSFDAQVAARFIHEARTVARLGSDHTVRIYDVDTLPDGTPFMVMEYLQGNSLAQLVEQGPLAIGIAVDYVLQACEALAEAHAANIVHRDIKPGNLMLTEGPGAGFRLKLVDFGIAKVSEAWSEPSSTPRTADGAVMGTPFYMSPEQIRSPAIVDPRTDIWSLGVVLFELLTGSRPFDMPGFSELIAKILEAPPRPTPASFPAGLRDVIRRCLEKDRAKRFSNVGVLARALAPFAGDRVEAARLADRATQYLDSGVSYAKTVIGLNIDLQRLPSAYDEPRSATARSRGVTQDDDVIDAERSDPWHAFETAVPAQMAADRTALAEVFSRAFEASLPVADNIVKLLGASIVADEQTEFFAVFMAHAPIELGGQPVLSTGTFAAYVGPLRAYLEKLGSAGRKVVIVITGSGELGPGVRASIGEYRRNLNTFVVPIWLREIQRAYVQDGGWDLVERRLHDLHARQDPFVIELDSLDPMRCVGLCSRVNEVVSALQEGGRIINIIALPGSGKSTLVRLIQYELAARSFIVLRCSEGGRSPRALGREILAGIAAIAGDGTQDTVDRDDFSNALSSQLKVPFLPRKIFATSLQRLTKPPLLVLEDADWLIALVASPECTPARDEARALWTTLGEVSRRHKLDVILTSVRGYELDRSMLDGWENPTRPHTVSVALLSAREAALLVRELSTGVASFLPSAVAKLHRATRGNVGLTLAVCSAAFRASASRSDSSPLVPVTVTERDIEDAEQRVASMDKPIGPLFNTLLSEDERQVLRTIATNPSRSLRRSRRVLRDHAAVDRAMRELQAMGMIDFVHRRYQVAIPVVAAWAKRHVVQTEYQAASVWRSRTRYITVGAILSTLLFATYFVWIRNQRTDREVVSSNGCTYRVDLPERAEYQVPVVVYAFRSCPAMPKDTGLTLRASRVAAQIVVPAGDPCATQADCMIEASVTLKVQKDGRYPFVLRTSQQDVLDFTIDHDALAGMKATLSDVFRLMSFLPILLGLGLAFYSDVLRAVRSWFKRDPMVGSDAASPPTAG